jgi:hypothetical protein
MFVAVQTGFAHSWERGDEAFFVHLSGDKAMDTTSSSFRTDDQSSRIQRLHAFFLTLAARRRELAEKATNPESVESHLKLAAGYEALAETFAELNQRQLANARGTNLRAGKPA